MQAKLVDGISTAIAVYTHYDDDDDDTHYCLAGAGVYTGQQLRGRKSSALPFD